MTDSADVPDCFSLERDEKGTIVNFRYTNLAFTQIFLAVWLVLWGGVCLALFNMGFASESYFTKALLAGFVLGWLAGLYGILYFPNVRKSFCFASDSLDVTTTLFGMTRGTAYQPTQISCLYVSRPRRRNATSDKNWSVLLEMKRNESAGHFGPSKRVSLLSGLTQPEVKWIANLVSNWSEAAIKYQIGRNEPSILE
ncbi:MAG: hypothetical protein AAGI63_15045 [Planctomycetota bacterium]